MVQIERQLRKIDGLRGIAGKIDELRDNLEEQLMNPVAV